MDGTVFLALVEKSLDRYEAAFVHLQKQNDRGHIEVQRGNLELTIQVKGVGPYRFFADM